jgi:hypothetical protein
MVQTLHEAGLRRADPSCFHFEVPDLAPFRPAADFDAAELEWKRLAVESGRKAWLVEHRRR